MQFKIIRHRDTDSDLMVMLNGRAQIVSHIGDPLAVIGEGQVFGEIALIDHQVAYEPRTVTGFQGEPVEALSLSSVSRELGEAIGIHLLVHDHDDLRGALKPDRRGRKPRGDLPAVRALIEA